MRIQVPVSMIEFDEGGHTIWVHSDVGTVLRIKTLGAITVEKQCQNICAHADILVVNDIHICLPAKEQKP